jgi:hypothetical protein
MPLSSNHSQLNLGQSSMSMSHQFDLPLVYRILVQAYLRSQEKTAFRDQEKSTEEKGSVL